MRLAETMLVSYHGTPIDQSLEIVAISDHEWRVCDGRIDEADASRLLGYVEKLEDRYEVLKLVPPVDVWEDFDCLAAALAALSERCPRATTAAA